MIKLNRGECPKELTDEVKEELTELYKKDKEKCLEFTQNKKAIKRSTAGNESWKMFVL